MSASNPPESASEKLAGTSPLSPEERFNRDRVRGVLSRGRAQTRWYHGQRARPFRRTSFFIDFFWKGRRVMRVSQQLTRTLRESPRDSEGGNHDLLVRAGFIRQL